MDERDGPPGIGDRGEDYSSYTIFWLVLKYLSSPLRGVSCVTACVCVCVCVCARVHVCTCVCMCVCAHTCVCVCAHACMCVHVYMCTCVCVCVLGVSWEELIVLSHEVKPLFLSLVRYLSVGNSQISWVKVDLPGSVPMVRIFVATRSPPYVGCNCGLCVSTVELGW